MNLNRTNAYLKRVMILGGKTLVTQLSLINPLVLGVYADDYLWRKIYKEKEHFIFYEMNVGIRVPKLVERNWIIGCYFWLVIPIQCWRQNYSNF